MTPAGIAWCKQFPESTSISDLIDPFRGRVLEFVSALEAQGARVTVAATYRPVERAYLMHYCGLVAHEMPPEEVPPMAGVDIEWDLGSPIATRVAAADMVRGYGIVYAAALVSRHTQRRAIDMAITGFHLTGQALWDMGKSFGVIKLVSDAPHWSDDGH